MPVLTKRRRAEMEATARGRAQLEAEANLELPTPKRRRTNKPKQSTRKVEHAPQQTPPIQHSPNIPASPSPVGSDKSDCDGADVQIDVEAQILAEWEAHHQPTPSTQPAEHTPDSPDISDSTPEAGPSLSLPESSTPPKQKDDTPETMDATKLLHAHAE